HDLEIRGAGELLGEDQSGHIQAIGYTLYTELLDRAVKAMQNGELPDDLQLMNGPEKNCEIELHQPAFIPDSYINDINTRLILYKRIASANDAEILSELRIELIDRFGKLPEQVRNLFDQVEIKWQARKLGIKRIEANATGGRLDFIADNTIDPERMIDLL